MRYLGDNLHEGDVILSNHPAAGGSHLPDLTVITPVSTAAYMHALIHVYCRLLIFLPKICHFEKFAVFSFHG